MPTLVQFGAGNIGRGFIAPTFAFAGWEVVFVDVSDAMLAAISGRGGYLVHEVDNDGTHQRSVSGISAIDGRDRDAVSSAVAGSDLLATAVGLGALGHLGGGIAAGLERRWQHGGRPLDILVCENGVQAPELLQEAISSHAAQGVLEQMEGHLGLVRTSIGRMVPPPMGDDPLDIAVEPYATLPVEAGAFRGPIPDVPGLKAVPNFDLVLLQKLHLHNGTHACLAYSGLRKGYATIPECMEDANLVESVARAAEEVIESLARTYADTDLDREHIRQECQALYRDLFIRYRNKALADPLTRVARDPIRKLAADDRLIGAAQACLVQGIAPLALCRHILDACAYEPADDEPRASEFRTWSDRGWRAVLHECAGITEGDPLMNHLAFAERQAVAAERIRAAGMHIRDDEAANIEIADFGLDRFEEIGLAILVYVNTESCCAKELAMLPGQLCPEHRHPPVDGKPGKEETFRVRAGEVHLFLPGHKKDSGEREHALQLVPADKRDAFTVFKHVHLWPGDQYTLKANTPHWFVAGSEGAVVSEFSTASRDEADIFTDDTIIRVPDAQ